MESILKFFETNPFYVVLFITLIIWTGLFFYILTLDNKLKKIENSNNNHHE